jgi:peptidoglycan/LPS O-acetylase OafA/YrhL
LTANIKASEVDTPFVKKVKHRYYLRKKVSESNKPINIPALDGLRGIAVLLVLLVHLGRGGHHWIVLKIFFLISEFGWSGVDLFFVLSGFLITNILLSTKNDEKYFVHFYIRRALRIFPIYYGTILLVYLILPVVYGKPSNEGNNPLWLIFYLSNLLPAYQGTGFLYDGIFSLNFSHFWSLAVEEHFYLLWPAIVYQFSRQRLQIVCFLLVISSIALRCFLLFLGVDYDVIYTFTFCRIDSLAIGAFIATVYNKSPNLNCLTRPAVYSIILLISLLVTNYIIFGNIIFNNWLCSSIGYTIIALGYAGIIVLCIEKSRFPIISHICEFKLLRIIGKYSYGIYVIGGLFWKLFNDGIMSVEKINLLTGSYFAAVLIHLVSANIVIFSMAWISWHLFEKWFVELKDKFRYDFKRI